jgi:hypothetical protein
MAEPIRSVVRSRVGGREGLAEVGARVETLCFSLSSLRLGTARVAGDVDGGARLRAGLKSAIEMELWEGLRM